MTQIPVRGIYIDSADLPSSSGRTLLTANALFNAASSADILTAYQTAQRTLDLAGQWKVIVQLTAGFTFTDTVTLTGPLVGALGSDSFEIVGSIPNPGAILLQGPPGKAAFLATQGAAFNAHDFAFNPGAGGNCFTAAGGTIDAWNIWYTTNGGASIFDAAGGSSSITARGANQLWNQTAPINIVAVSEDHGQINITGSWQLMSTPAWTTAFVQGDLGGIIDGTGFTFTGTGTGPRYDAVAPGIVFTGTGTAPPDFFPGSSPGSGLYYS